MTTNTDPRVLYCRNMIATHGAHILGPELTGLALERFDGGCKRYGPGNFLRAGFDLKREHLEELLDAFVFACMGIASDKLSLDTAGNVMSLVGRAAREVAAEPEREAAL